MQDELKDAILQEIPEAQMELVVGEDGEDEPTLEYKYYQLWFLIRFFWDPDKWKVDIFQDPAWPLSGHTGDGGDYQMGQ